MNARAESPRTSPVGPAADDGSPLSNKPWAGALILLALAILAYLPVLHAAFIWDDDDYVTQNPALLTPAGLKSIWCDPAAAPQYYPLVFSTFWLEEHAWGLSPTGYHVDNVLLHALGAILLWRLLARLKVPGAWLAAALFACHPVAVESVAWVTERKNVLSGICYFAAAMAYLRFRPAETPAAEKKTGGGGAAWYLGALFLFAAALLAKSVTASLPAALLLVYWWKKNLRWQEVVLLLPFFALGMGLGLNTAWLEKHHVGAQGSDWSLSFAERILVAGRALWFYAGKLVWPHPLAFVYPRWNVATSDWRQWLFPVTALVVIATLWFRRHLFGRGPLIAVLFFAGTLFPALGFVNVYPMRFSFVADHFQYLACVGLLALAAAGLVRLAPAKCLWVLPVLLAALTWHQAHLYHDQETLWRDTLAKNPGCWLAHNNLGILLKNRGDLDGATAEYQTALSYRQDYPEALQNLGEIYFLEGKPAQAIQSYEAALNVEPDLTPALNGLGASLLVNGEPKAAEASLRRSLSLQPNDADALSNLGSVLTAEKQDDAARAAFEKALSLQSDRASQHVSYGDALWQMGRTDEAIGQFQAAESLAPGDAHTQAELAHGLAMAGHSSEAIEHYRDAIQLGLRDPAAIYNFATLLGAVGRIDEAIAQFRVALQLQPDNVEAYNNLGVTLLVKGDSSGAKKEIEEALRLKPDYAEAHNNLAYALIRLGQPDAARQHLLEALRLKPGYVQAQQQLDALSQAH